MSEIRENVIEWITGDDRVCLTFTQPKYITKVRKLVDHYNQHNDNRADMITNPDGSVFAHLPLECLKLSPKRNIEHSDEWKDAARERLVVARSKKNSHPEDNDASIDR